MSSKRRAAFLWRTRAARALTLLPLVGLLVVASTITACSPSREAMLKSLAFSAEELNRGVRWRRHGRVAALMSKPLRSSYLDRVEQDEDGVQVSEVTLLRTETSDGGKKAVLRYRYRWHRADRGLLRSSVVVQRWSFKKKGTWILEGIGPGAGPVFPLFQGLEGEPRPRAPARPARPRTSGSSPDRPRSSSLDGARGRGQRIQARGRGQRIQARGRGQRIQAREASMAPRPPRGSFASPEDTSTPSTDGPHASRIRCLP